MLFPELGLDLVEEGEEESHSLSIRSSSWEQNWLFKRGGGGEETREGVTMLVPNPSSITKAQIGNKDFDLVGDLTSWYHLQMSSLLGRRPHVMVSPSNVILTW